MAITIAAEQRDALYGLLVLRLSAIGDVSIAMNNHGYADAKRLGRRYADEIRLLDDLGWEAESARSSFELTMPPADLRRVLGQVQQQSMGSVREYVTRPKDEEQHACEDLAVAAACGAVLNALALHEPEEEPR